MAPEYSSFEEIDHETSALRNMRPLWTLNLDDPANEKQILNWLVQEINHLEERSLDRIRQIQKNLALYKGIQYETQAINNRFREINTEKARIIPKIVVNHLYDLTEHRTNRLIKFKPAVAVLPTNDEFEDKISAKMVTRLLDHIWYEHDFDGTFAPEVARNASITGESFLFIVWNPDLGDDHPDSKKNEKITLLNDHGTPQTNEMGQEIKVDADIKTGDVQYQIAMANDVFLQRKHRLEDSEYCFRKMLKPCEELRLMYPKAADKIKDAQGTHVWDYDRLELRNLTNETVYYEFYHKFTKPMPKGRYIVFNRDGIFVNRELGYNHGELPFERFSDIDLPGEVHGVSFYNNVKALTSTYNNLTNLVVRNHVMVSHPKWMLPAGSAKLESLGNDITICQYKGAVPPQLVQSNPTPSEVFAFRAQLKEEFQQISGVFGVSRGEPPPGIKAGVALQFLNEQENERFNIQIAKWNDFLRRVAIKTIAVCGDYYDASDQRMIRILGKGGRWMSKFFDVSHLSKSYDVRMQNSSALPESKAARTQSLIDLNKEFPGLFPEEQLVEMLDLAQTEKFMDQATVAVQAAEAENEQIMDDDDVADPEEYENHVLHWKIHVRLLQDWSFKNQSPAKVKKKLKDHVLATEMMLWESAQRNPAYMAQISTIPMFPIFYRPVMTAVQPTPVQPQPGAGGPPPPDLGPFPPGLGAPSPVNPTLGGPPQLPVNPPMPGIQAQILGTGSPPVIPAPQPSRAV